MLYYQSRGEMMKSKRKWMGILAMVLVFGFTVAGCRDFNDMHKISNYLSLARRVGRSADGPVPLIVKVNLDNNWESLLSVINSAGVFVNLDISRSTMTNTAFDPGSRGSEYIVSLNLPDTVTGIAGDFNVFPNLAGISFPASLDLGDVNPFVGCSSLTFKLKGRGDLSSVENGRALVRGGNELVSYPSASGSVTLLKITAIGRSAFNGAGLESIRLPDAASIGMRAFRGCENLQSADLPAATAIDDEAFYGNTGLQTLNIPAVVTLGKNAAANTGNVDLTITVGAAIDTIGTGMFNEVNSRKNVTVRAPQSEVEKIDTMRNAFRGRGWSEGSFTLAAQGQRTTGSGWWAETVLVNNFNSNINLTVEGY
jgi:hypothetical protein